jgi:hypothetical protein
VAAAVNGEGVDVGLAEQVVGLVLHPDLVRCRPRSPWEAHGMPLQFGAQPQWGQYATTHI